MSNQTIIFSPQRIAKAAVSVTAVCLGFVVFSIGLATGQFGTVRQQDGAPPPGSGPIDYTGFVRVIDGDTVEIYPDGNRTGVGLIGINAPPGNTPCGQAAIKLLQLLSTGGLYLKEDAVIGFDARKRRKYYAIARSNVKVAQELVKAGVAHSAGEGEDKDELGQQENNAQNNRVGCLHGGNSTTGNSTVGLVQNQALIDSGISEDHSAGIQGTATARAATAPAAATSPAGGFSQQVVASGFSNPTGFVFLPDGRILVSEKHGIVKVVKNGSVLGTPFIDISSRVNDYWDHGLIGMAADPNFATNGFVYLLYVYENNAADFSGTKTGRLSRFTASGDTAALSTELVVLGTSVGTSCQNFPAGTDCLTADGPSHSMGQIRFDSSGNMFVTAGDSASFNVVDDLALRAQDLTSLAGKVMHVTPLGAGLPSNPFWTGSASANQSKVWAYGVRNAFRFNLRNGLYPYLGDVGWNTWEEIDAATAKSNLGWPCYEGVGQQAGYAPKSVCQALYAKGTSAVKSGVITYDHFRGGAHVSTAALAGTFYTGTVYPAKYQGAHFYGDYGQNWIRYLTVDTNDNIASGPFDFLAGADGPTQIEQGPDGNLYYVSIVKGEIRKLVFGGADTVPPTITSVNPPANATAVSLSATVSATFSELLDPNSVGTNLSLTVKSTGQPIAGSVVYDLNTATITLTPSALLTANTVYQATAKGGANGVKDLAGNPLAADQVWSFTTFANQPPPSGTTDLSSTSWVTMTNGWGPAEIDMSNGEQAPRDGHTISIRQKQYPKGVGVNAPSHIHYYLGNSCSTLTATVGVDDEVGGRGSVVFQVFGDSTKLFDSGLLTGTSPGRDISVNITGTNDMELAVTDGGDGTAFDHADWAQPKITCGSQAPTTITNVQATQVTATSATINWTTNNPADSQVDYGTTTAYGSSTTLDSQLKTTHSQNLTGLTANTAYFYRVKSRDSGSTLVTSANSFQTPGGGPTVTITSPVQTLTYKVGDMITYAGSAKDKNGTAIPPSGLAWQIIIHHCPGGNCHIHPDFLNSTGAGGTFTIPDHGDESFFELKLTATDSGGLTGTASVAIQPQTVQLTLATIPSSSLQVVYSGTTLVSPANIKTIIGSKHTIQVPSPQGTNTFVSWSDGGAQQHDITIGSSNATITATFATSGGSTKYLGSDVVWTSMTNGWGPVEIDKSNGEQAAGDGHTITLGPTTALKTFPKGLGTNAASDVRFAIPQGCSTFTATVGVDHEVHAHGSVIFQVWTDAVKVYESPVMKGLTDGLPISININGKSQLQLIVTNAGDGNAFDHADWADAKLSCP